MQYSIVNNHIVSVYHFIMWNVKEWLKVDIINLRLMVITEVPMMKGKIAAENIRIKPLYILAMFMVALTLQPAYTLINRHKFFKNRLFIIDKESKTCII